MYAYGPVPSRRLGNSIGVSPIPAKVCSYSCVYCQLGRTSTLQAKRQRFFPKEDIIRDIGTVVGASSADVITFAGDGEPTLCRDLGWLIRKTRQEFGLPVAVITNASIMFHADVQEDLQGVDILLPTLDAGNQDMFRRINRPHRSINFDNMIEGLAEFQKGFAGRLWLEVMLIKDVNDSNEQLTMIRDAVAAVQPDKVFVMTPIRPPAEDWVACPEPERVRVAEKILAGAVAEQNREEGDFGVAEFADASEAILEISARHPLRLEQARAIEKKFADTGAVDKLLRDKKILLSRYRQTDYIKPEKSVKIPERVSGCPGAIAVDRINCCNYRVTIDTGRSKRRYRVVLADGYYHNLARGRLSKEDLLEECFCYLVNNALLEQLEPRFSLRDIGKKFPELEKAIKETVAGRKS